MAKKKRKITKDSIFLILFILFYFIYFLLFFYQLTNPSLETVYCIGNLLHRQNIWRTTVYECNIFSACCKA